MSDLNNLKEKLAAIEHERWADWQQWMHNLCDRNEDGSLTISWSLVERWERQIATHYSELSDKEKASDMEQVDRYWPLILDYLNRVVPEKKQVDELINIKLKKGDVTAVEFGWNACIDEIQKGIGAK